MTKIRVSKIRVSKIRVTKIGISTKHGELHGGIFFFLFLEVEVDTKHSHLVLNHLWSHSLYSKNYGWDDPGLQDFTDIVSNYLENWDFTMVLDFLASFLPRWLIRVLYRKKLNSLAETAATQKRCVGKAQGEGAWAKVWAWVWVWVWAGVVRHWVVGHKVRWGLLGGCWLEWGGVPVMME